MISLCNQTLNSSAPISKENEGLDDSFQDHSNLCDNEYCCPLDPAINSSVTFSKNGCTSSGLSFTCNSNNAPFWATSITVFGLNQRFLTFDKSFVNLKEINIINCIIDQVNIDSDVMIQTLTISNSLIFIAVVEDKNDYLRYFRITDSNIYVLGFSLGMWHSFEFFVHNSKLYYPEKKFLISTTNVNLSNSVGFADLFLYYYVTTVNLSYCSLDYHPQSFDNIDILDLSHNNMSYWFYSSWTQTLHLQNNSITAIRYVSDLRHSEARLQYLDLSYNLISFIDEYDFFNLPNLLHLDMRNNGIAKIHENAFSFIIKLLFLDLSNNNLHFLGQKHFLHLSNLQYLYLQNNDIKVVDGMFDGLMSIEYLHVDFYTLCCAQPKTTSKIQCKAPVNEISSCTNLIDVPLLSTFIWYMALFAVFGNILGPIYKGVKSANYSSFVMCSINLGAADFLMGIYLFIIAGANLMFSGHYGLEDESWRNSHVCTLAGVLAILSSEASVFFVLLITIDIILIILYPSCSLRKRNWFSLLISIVVWIVSLILSLLPLFGIKYFNGYYSSSGICISLPLSVPGKFGWGYSMILFVGANFGIFIAILLGQLFIFVNLICVGKQINSNNTIQQRKEISLGKTLIAVAITDMSCWIPIGVIGK